MGTLNNKRISSLQTALLALALGLGAAACGDDDNPTPGGPPVIGLPDGGPVTNLDAGLDSGVVTTDGGSDGSVPPPANCTGAANCVCAPKTSVEFLNSCTTGACRPFDNKARIPGFTGTKLPLQ
jgi:hypothetical protein